MPRHGTSVLMVVGIYNLKCTTDRVIVFPSCAGKMILNMLPHNSCKAPWVAVLIACAREAITEWVPSTARCSFILFHSSTRAVIPQSLLYGHFGLFGFWCIIKFQEVNRKACNWSDFHDFTQSCHYVRHCPTMSMWWHAYGSATSRPIADGAVSRTNAGVHCFWRSLASLQRSFLQLKYTFHFHSVLVWRGET